MLHWWWGIVAAFALVLFNGFFVATEFAIVKVRRTRLRELEKRGPRIARLPARRRVAQPGSESD